MNDFFRCLRCKVGNKSWYENHDKKFKCLPLYLGKFVYFHLGGKLNPKNGKYSWQYLSQKQVFGFFSYLWVINRNSISNTKIHSTLSLE